MNKKFRSFILAAIAVVTLPFVFVVLQGFLARYYLPPISALQNIIGGRAAVSLTIYGYGLVGSALSAILIVFPLGLWLHVRPWFVGATVGMVAVLELIIVSHKITPSNYFEYIGLIIFSSLASGVGSRIKRQNR